MAEIVKMSSNSKMEIHKIVKKKVAKHNINATKDFYLKLTMSPYIDLVMERNSDIVLVGHYGEENGDLLSYPVPAMEGKEIWSLVRIELWCRDTICAFYEDGKRMIYPDRMKEFRGFQRMFTRNIREQRRLENGGMVENV
jgi:hypothetical protein